MRDDGIRVVRGETPDIDPNYEDEPCEYNWAGQRGLDDDEIRPQDPGWFRGLLYLAGSVALAGLTWGVLTLADLLAGRR